MRFHTIRLAIQGDVNQSTNGATMSTFTCTTAELLTPEFLRLLAIATTKENQRLQKLSAARRALSLCNRLRAGDTKKKNNARIFRALNQLRAAA